MFGLDANLVMSALISLFGLAGSVGAVLFFGGRWTARIEAKRESQGPCVLLCAPLLRG